MKLNCDLGEGLPHVDAATIPLIDMANIACGGHAGNEASMESLVSLAQQHHVLIGAHPSYPDRNNFGRISLDLAPAALERSLINQIDSLRKICESQNAQISYIKAHGALYTDAVKDSEKLALLFKLCEQYSVDLMTQAFNDNSVIDEIASNYRVKVIFEAFADRAYKDNAQLVPRSEHHAVHATVEQIVEQAKNLITKQRVMSESGNWLNLDAQTLCVHGDGLNAIETVRKIRHLNK